VLSIKKTLNGRRLDRNNLELQMKKCFKNITAMMAALDGLSGVQAQAILSIPVLRKEERKSARRYGKTAGVFNWRSS